MHNNTEIMTAILFCASGFFLTFFLKRGLNLILLGIFLYAVFHGFEAIHYHADWNSLSKFTSTLQQLAKILLTMIQNMISAANILTIMAFLIGGMIGLSWRRIE